MLLLDFARAYAEEAGLTLAVVHFNHHLRGADSNGDEEFVRQRARELGIEFYCSGTDVTAAARAKKGNLEAVARDVRYRFFFSLVRQGQVDKVATAHTANDQAETVLLRLIRGAGTRGLGGIHPVLEGGVVRPFLGITRSQVEAEIAVRGLACRMDSSNRETHFARNRLRQRVLPLLEREFNPRVVESLAGFADRARDDDAFLEEQARERCMPWLRRVGGTVRIPAGRLADFPPAIARRVLRRMVAETVYGTSIISGPITISHTEMGDLHRLAGGPGGRRVMLGAGAVAWKEFEWLVIGRASRQNQGRSAEQGAGFSYLLRPPATIEIPELGIRLDFSFADDPNDTGANKAEEEYTAVREIVWLDSVNPAASLTLRSWRAGDRIHPLGHIRPVKLKELFQRRRVPVQERLWWPVLDFAGDIVWAKGFPLVGSAGQGQGKRLRIREEHLGAGHGVR
jgi:tRNA(Ile)-lysidine synthase